MVFTDSDPAGCFRTRKSTPSKLFCGSHVPRSTSTMQGVIALCWGESEFYVLVSGTSAGLGAVSMLKDLGADISKNTQIGQAFLEVRIDASAGQGIAARRGAHIATPTFWGAKAHARRQGQKHENPWSLESTRFRNQTS